MSKDIAQTNETLERKLATHSASLDKIEQELRQLLLSESSRLSAATEERYKEAIGALARTSAQLQSDLVSRSSLSSTFSEFALRLAGELSLSGEDKETAAAAGNPDGGSREQK